jgi:predicted nucleotidyltransferase
MDVKTLHTKEQIVELLEKNRKQIQAFGVSKLGLFGSYAKGEQTTDSDIDFIVEFRQGEKNYANLLALVDYLETLFDSKVDVVTKDAIAEWLQSYIDEDVVYVQFNH